MIELLGVALLIFMGWLWHNRHAIVERDITDATDEELEDIFNELNK